MKRYQRSKKILAFLLILSFSIQTVAVDGLVGKSKTEEKQITAEEEPPTILGEIKEFRTEYSKSYLQSDGTYLQATSFDPLHFEKEGRYVEIDNRLEAVTKGKKTTYQNKQGNYQVQFPETIGGQIKVHSGSQKLNM